MQVSERVSIFENIQTKLSYFSDEDLFINVFCSKLCDEIDMSKSEKEKEVLNLVYQINRIYLNEDMTHPFAPYKRTLSGITSVLPEFFTQEDLDFFYQIYNNVKNKMFKARIADVLWYLKYTRDISKPQFSVSVYTSLDITTPDKLCKKKVYIRRGLYLAKQISFKIEELDNQFTKLFLNRGYEGNAYLVRLAGILREFHIGKRSEKEIMAKLISYGEKLEQIKQFYLAEQYYDEASKWCSKEKYVELQVKRAYSYIHKAEEVESKGLIAGQNYKHAIQIIRRLDKNERSKYITPQKEEELIAELQSAGRFLLSQMEECKITLDKSDTAKVVEDISSKMKGKNKQEALKQFAFITDFVKVRQIEQTAINMVQDSPLLALSTYTMYASDGRVISHVPGINDNSPMNMNNPFIWYLMMRNYNLQISMTTQMGILTALNIIADEHFVRESDIAEIVSSSNIISPNRQKLFVKGLMAGFSFDFITAIHLLVPQIENLVREQFHLNKVRTIILDPEGIEVEAGLSTLVKKTQFSTIFGEDIAFEIKALLCDATGLNLRNNVAHGLWSESEMNSVASVYFWWFCFKLVYLQSLK